MGNYEYTDRWYDWGHYSGDRYTGYMKCCRCHKFERNTVANLEPSVFIHKLQVLAREHGDRQCEAFSGATVIMEDGRAHSHGDYHPLRPEQLRERGPVGPIGPPQEGE